MVKKSNIIPTFTLIFALLNFTIIMVLLFLNEDLPIDITLLFILWWILLALTIGGAFLMKREEQKPEEDLGSSYAREPKKRRKERKEEKRSKVKKEEKEKKESKESKENKE